MINYLKKLIIYKMAISKQYFKRKNRDYAESVPDKTKNMVMCDKCGYYIHCSKIKKVEKNISTQT